MGNAASSNKSNEQLKDPSHDSREHLRPKRGVRRRESVNSSHSARAPSGTTSEKASQASQSQAPASTHSRNRLQTQVPVPSKPQGNGAATTGGSVARSVPVQQDAAKTSPKEQISQGSPQTRTPPRPVPTDPNIQKAKSPNTEQLSTSNATPSSSYAPNTQYIRPPRLPLPIEQEVLSPGSPIISPADVPGDPIGKDDEEVLNGRKGSLVSSTGYDEDIGEDYNVPVPSAGPTLDTLIEWKQEGEKVYVTGSFSGWNKKHRLHRK